MFKKSLSMLLSIIILLSCFGSVVVSAADMADAKSLFAVTSSPVKNGLVTYTINVTANQSNIAGAVILVEYDSSVLKPLLCEPAKTTNATNGTTQNFEGTFLHGVTEDDSNIYSIAYMNQIAVSTGVSAKPFFNMVFEVVDSTRPKTSVKFFCREYYSTSEPEKNILPSDGLKEIRFYENFVTLEAPKAGDISPSAEGFNMTWSSVEGADGYIVYRSSPSEGKKVVGETSGRYATSYTDSGLESGVTYSYTIAAYSNNGSISVDSNILKSKYIAKPQISSVANVSDGVEIRWTKTDGATNYYIMRRASGEAEWIKIAIRSANLDTIYKDKNVKDGVEYEYDVNSATDSFVSVSATEGERVLFVKAPQIKLYENVVSGIQLKWEAHPKATYYVIYRRAINSETTLTKYAETNDSSYLDTAVVPGAAYTYAIKTCTNLGDSAYNITGYTITRVPSTTVTALESEKSAVKVSWAPIENIDGYVIYRKTPSGDWQKAGTVTADKSSFSDTGVVSGTQYTFAVCPLINNSEGAKIASGSIYFIKAPSNVLAVNEKNGIAVSWDRVGGASSYVIYRKDSTGQTILCQVVEGNYTTTYFDMAVEEGVKYTYTIVADNVLAQSKESETSNTLYRWSEELVATPTLGIGGINVTWQGKEYAEGYVLYRGCNGVWTPITQTDKTSYLDTDVVSNQQYAYAVSLVVEGSQSTLFKPEEPQIRFIGAPVTLTTTNGNGYTNLTWEAVDGAVNYYVYKAIGETGEYSLVAMNSADELEYRDTSVVPGETVYYAVRSYNGENLSAFSTAKRSVYLKYPVIKSVTNDFAGQVISWNSVEGATGYRVYRKIYGEQYYTYITTVDANTLTYTEKNPDEDKIMCYTVRACNGDSISAYAGKCMTYVKAPQVALSNSPSGVYLKWDKITGAQGYYVYRKAAGARSWTRIAAVKTLYYTDTKVKSGTNYLYTVKAYKGNIMSGCNMSGWGLMHLSTPVLTSQSNGYGAITTFWKAVPGAKSYNVYRKADKETNWTYIGNTTGTLYRDATVKSLSTYTYTVRAVNGKDISSFNYTGRTMKYLTAPTITISNSTTGIYLTWNRVNGASSYYIYRKAGNAKTWTRINIVTGNSYLDVNVKPGVTYTYTIRANGSKTLSGCNSYGWKTVYINTPKLVSALSYPTGVQVRWQKVPVATSYVVYRKAKGDKSWTLIGTVKGNSTVTFIDRKTEQGTVYTYTVRAAYGNYRSWFQSGVSCTANY
ncbi:MAG: hypothetical protein IIX14_04925 [Clostridia bacterium]|nr:hypothetical protein [Clostridia bacterium]